MAHFPQVSSPTTTSGALAQFAVLTVLAASIFDRQGNFPRSLRWLCLGALGASVAVLLAHASQPPEQATKGINAHLLLASAAYSMFLMSFVQMIEVWLLNRAIARHEAHAAGRISLLDMEQIVFRNICWSFVLLTLTMLSGILSSVRTGGVTDTAGAHEVLFASMTWICCAVLLVGRWKWGWRGVIAYRWFAASSIALVVNYVTVVILIEVLLG